MVVVATLIVLTPWRLQFAHHPHALITNHLDLDPPHESAQVYRTLAYWNGVHYDRNGRKLEALLGVFGVACASLVGEIMAPKPKPPSTPDSGTYETRKPKR